MRFAAVGAVGFAIDASTLFVCLEYLGLDPFRGRLVSYLVAASSTWALNRRFTFIHRQQAPVFRQWLTFLGANALGGLVNYGTYAAIVSALPGKALIPFVGVACGSISGLAVNFALSRWVVFGSAKPSGATDLAAGDLTIRHPE